MPVWMLLAACGTEPAAPPPAPAPTPAPPAVPDLPPLPPAPVSMLTRTAKVVEVAKGGGYTYARMDACGQEAWVAGPETDLKVGESVEMPLGNAMTNFEAKALGRTFDQILFVDWFEPAAHDLVCAPPPGTAVAGPQPRMATPAKRIGVVKETMNGGGYTYARIDVCGQEEWIAGPAAKVTVGQAVATTEGAMMAGFTAPSLNRTFDQIRFVDLILPADGPPVCK
jgi:hypothetical protein